VKHEKINAAGKNKANENSIFLDKPSQRKYPLRKLFCSRTARHENQFFSTTWLIHSAKAWLTIACLEECTSTGVLGHLEPLRVAPLGLPKRGYNIKDALSV
jgi:hypothetical protein